VGSLILGLLDRGISSLSDRKNIIEKSSFLANVMANNTKLAKNFGLNSFIWP
jgi:hypothetical protein